MNDLPMIAGAAGGCFRKGTLVQLEHGKTIPIEDLWVGDEILAFDENGDLHVAKVEKLHIHEEKQPILHVKFWRGEVFITPNHWVLNQYSSFVEIQTLTIEDALVDGMGHLRPIISMELVGYEPVYNLTVEKHHTFIANGIRVHNGGHRETYPVVAGAAGGGGKGGGGRAAKEDPESLQSKAMVSVLDLLGEGQIGGLLNGAQSIFFNETPLQNSDGTYNFKGVSWDARYGTQGQTYIPGHSDIETPTTLSVQCKTTAPVTFSITNPNADRVRVIVMLPSLTSTDLTTGDMHGTTVEYKFQMSVNGGVYQDIIADYTWDAATVGVSGTFPSVTSVNPSASQVSCVIRLNAAGVAPYALQNWGAEAVIQPEKWTGSAWLAHGPTITISATPYSRNAPQVLMQNILMRNQLSKDSFYQTNASSVRFRTVSITAGATISLHDPKAYVGNPNIVISGKTRSRYQRHHILELKKPATTWNIRMVRITPDSTSGALTNDTYLDAYVEIVDAKMTYPNSAVIGVSIDSALFNKIPTRSYLVKGLYIRYPSNYNPTTREYSGTWDGTFKVDISNGNPAWTLYDILTNERYGLGQYIGDDGKYVDKAALYQIGKYCDVMVPDGFGGFEPRFTINTVIQTLAEAYRLITDICSVFQGMAYWAGGQVSFTQDSPKDPSMVYSPANVINGEFNYVGSARRDRHSVVHVIYNDPLDGYKQKIEYIEDQALIAKYGIRKLEIVGFGCVSRGQANRIGRWILYSEQEEGELISFGVGLDSSFVLPGEIVKINNPTRAGKRMGGRLIGISATSATLDAPITTTSPATISMRLPDGTFVDRNINGTINNSSLITWTEALPTLPLVNSMFIVSEELLQPVLGRVLSRVSEEGKKGEYIITAHKHNPSKFAAIENGWSLSRPPTSIVKAKPDAPTNLVFTDVLYRSGANYASKLNASWDMDHSGELKGWNIRLLGPSNIWQEFETVTVASWEYQSNVVDGQDYIIEVRAVNILGIQSDATTATRTVLGKSANPSNVTGLVATATDNGIRLSWNNISDIDLAYYEVREGSDWETATVLGTTGNNFMELGNKPAGPHTWLVRARDTTDHYSTNDASVTLNVGIPDTPTVTAQFVGDNIEVAWSVVPCDNYFVEIVIEGVVKRSFTTTMNSFSYTLEIATADGGPWRQITVRVRARKNGNLSLPGEATSDYNAPPIAPTLVLNAGIKSVSVTVSRSEELDYAGTIIHASQTPGFTPDESNKVYEGSTFFMHTDITGTWYYRAAHYDTYGKSGLNYSIESNANALANVAGITTVEELPADPTEVGGQLAIFLDVSDPEVRGIYGWDGTQWVHTKGLSDGVVTEAKLAPDVLDILEDLEIAPGDIKAEHIASEAVTFDKLSNDLVFAVEIQEGEIETVHIANEAITYEKFDPALALDVEITEGEITETLIADDSISTPKLRANAVTTEKLTVGSFNNLCENNDFELGNTTGWSMTAGWALLNDSTNAYSGSWCMTRPGGSTGTLRNVTFKCIPGQKYIAQARIKHSAGSAGGAYVRITTYNSAGAETIIGNGNTIGPANTSYALSQVIASVPEGAINIRVEVVATNTTGTLYVDQCALSPYALTQIEDGMIVTEMIAADAIIADHIHAEAIEAEHIKSNAIQTQHIAANQIEALHIKANEITSEKIRAGAVTTSKLTVGNVYNLCENNDFELGDALWTKGANWSIVNDPANARNGSWVAKKTAGGTTYLFNTFFKCVPGQTYIAGAYIKASADAVGQAHVCIQPTDSAGNALTAAFGNIVMTTDWALSECRLTTPSNAVFVRVGIRGANTAGTIYIDQMVLTLNSVTIIDDGMISTSMIQSDAVRATHIKANEIDGDHIKFNEITGAHIVVDQIEANHIKSNAITTPKIAAGAITTAKLAVGSFSNLCENNDFEAGAADQSWTKETNWSIVNDPANAYSGSWCAMRTARATATALRNAHFKCIPGQKYIAGAYIKVSEGTTGGGYVRVSFFDAAMAYISVGGGAVNTITSTTYQRSETIVVVPENGVTMRVEVVATNTAGTVYVDQVSLTYNAVTIIENGMIMTDMIAANQIESDHIKANQITGAHILAGAVTTDHITTDSLSAINANMGDITSGTITLDNQGHIKGGMADYMVGTGYWIGYKGSSYKFAIGGYSGNYIEYNGTNLVIRGNIAIGYQNYIKGGQSAYNVGAGFFLGWDVDKYKFSVGNPSGKALTWDGATLTILGDIVTTSNVMANAISQVGNAYSSNEVRPPQAATSTSPPLWTTVQYLAFNITSGKPTIIDTFALIVTRHGVAAEARVLLNGTPIFQEYLPSSGVANQQHKHFFKYTDTFGAGAREYHLQVRAFGREDYLNDDYFMLPSVWNRSIMAIELKR